MEKFTPHDTVFSFASPSEVTESALSSACMLHASIGSMNSSTSSLARRRLGEIAEDAEEGGQGRVGRSKSGLRHSVLSDADSMSKDGKTNLKSPAPVETDLAVSSPLPGENASTSSAAHIPDSNPLPALDMFSPTDATKSSRALIDGKAVLRKEAAVSEEPAQVRVGELSPSFESRHSTSSIRPSASELDRANHYTVNTTYIPKVKRGPRPSTQRPRTAGSRGEIRPIASLPTSIRVSNRPATSTSRPPSSGSHRPTSQQSNRSAYSAFTNQGDLTPLPPVPHQSLHISALYQPPDFYLINRPASPAPSVTPSIPHSASPGITPEKQRLMRALQLRRKQQMAKSNLAKSPSPPVPSPDIVERSDDGSENASFEVSPVKEGHGKVSKPQPVHVETSESQIGASSEDAVTTKSGTAGPQESAGGSQGVTNSSDASQVDSTFESKDAGLLSSAEDDGPAASEGTERSLKSQSVTQIKPETDVGSPQPALDIEQIGESAANPDSAIIAERLGGKEESVAAALPSNPSSNLEMLIPANEEPSTQPRHTPSVGAEDEPIMSTGQSTSPTEVAEGRSPNDAGSVNPQPPDGRTLGRGIFELHKGDPSPEASDTSDDGSLYDELQTAIVEEAKPVMVARSPFSAVFNAGNSDRQRQHNRSTSIPKPNASESAQSTPGGARVDSGRSFTSALPQWPPTVEPAQSLLTNKSNVSSGISKRIRALEIFSGRSDTATSPSSPPAPPSPPLTAGLVKQRMSSHSLDDETTIANVSTTTPPAKRLQYPTPDLTPTPDPAPAPGLTSWQQRKGSNAEIHAPRKKGNSISVTARIVRNSVENNPHEPSNAPMLTTLNLRRSPLVVEHEKADPVFEPSDSMMVESAVTPVARKEPESTPMENRRSESRRFSLSSSHSNSGRMVTSESFTKRISMTIRRGKIEAGNLPCSKSDSSSLTEEKVVKDSRKIRLMKRVSVLTAGSRRSIASAFGSSTPRQEEAASRASRPPDSIAEYSGELSSDLSSIADSHTHVVDIGDVNIQFPDTLLWKRRFMRIDDQGYLILTPPTMETNKRGISRRFHLSDFKQPTLPPIEREELPWSIVLDFDDGSCLQCACESRYAQGQVLRSGHSPIPCLCDDADLSSSAVGCTFCISHAVFAVLMFILSRTAEGTPHCAFPSPESSCTLFLAAISVVQEMPPVLFRPHIQLPLSLHEK